MDALLGFSGIQSDPRKRPRSGECGAILSCEKKTWDHLARSLYILNEYDT